LSCANPAHFDFRKCIAYDDEAKRLFYLRAHRQLRCIADALGLPPGSYDLRSNQGVSLSAAKSLCTAPASMCRPASRRPATTAVCCTAAAKAAPQ